MGCKLIIFQLSCVVGICLSLYALFLEYTIANDKNYVALCDVSEWISCTKTFSSKYGKGFGLLGGIFGEKHILNQPNSVYGVIIYSVQILLSFFKSRKVHALNTLIVLLTSCGSVYLAYILFYVLKYLCIICVSMYAVNFLNLLTSLSIMCEKPTPRKNAGVSASRSNTYGKKKRKDN